jgi:predicted transcriptional regulator
MSLIINKEEVYRLVEQLPETATWEDLMYEIYVRESIEEGLADAKAGRLTSTSEVRKKYGLSE